MFSFHPPPLTMKKTWQLYTSGKQPVTNCFPKRQKEPFCLLCPKVICFRRTRTGPHLRGAAEKAHLKYWGIRSRGFSPPPAFLLQMVGGLWLIHGHFSSWNTQSMIEAKQCSLILYSKLFFMVFQKCFDQCIWQLTYNGPTTSKLPVLELFSLCELLTLLYCIHL